MTKLVAALIAATFSLGAFAQAAAPAVAAPAAATATAAAAPAASTKHAMGKKHRVGKKHKAAKAAKKAVPTVQKARCCRAFFCLSPAGVRRAGYGLLPPR